MRDFMPGVLADAGRGRLRHRRGMVLVANKYVRNTNDFEPHLNRVVLVQVPRPWLTDNPEFYHAQL